MFKNIGICDFTCSLDLEEFNYLSLEKKPSTFAAEWVRTIVN